MRDGVRLNTFVYLPEPGDSRYPVIVHRTPYGITTPQGEEPINPARGWLPDPNDPLRGSILRGWRQIVGRGYAAVYQDCRGRFGSEGEDRLYADDARDGFDTLEWIDAQPWCNHQIGLSGSSAGSTTALAAASEGHPSVKAFFSQVGSSSIYDDVVFQGQAIELERLWLWVANNLAGLSADHRRRLTDQGVLTVEQLTVAEEAARERQAALAAAEEVWPPFIDSDAWMRLPLTGYPDLSTLQPQLDKLLRHATPDSFRAQHNFRKSINIPGFHVTCWFDIFLTSVVSAFLELQDRVGDQHLWIGPNSHFFVYDPVFWPRDPYFEWFDYWLKGIPAPIVKEPPVFFSPRAWVEETETYVADDWRHATTWPPPGGEPERWYLRGDGSLGDRPFGQAGSYVYDPARPVPSVGGRAMLIKSGAHDQRPVQALKDYGLRYVTDVLPDDVTVAGPAEAVLTVSSDCPDTDFVVKVTDIHPDGRALLILEGVMRAMFRLGGVEPERLQPGICVQVRVDLGHIHHCFRSHHRIGVDVTSSNFPRMGPQHQQRPCGARR